MQVQVAETGPCSRSLTITVPPDRVREHVDRVYKSAQQQVQIKGFRPGKVPRQLLEKRWGGELLREAKEQLVNQFLGDACREREIQPVGRVQVDDYEKIETKPDTALQFTARVDVRPKFELQDTKGIEVEAFDGNANDQDVDNALAEVANQKRAMKPVDDAIQDGDFVKADLAFADKDGKVVHERKGTQVNTRVPVAGADPDAFAKALIGAKAGGTVELDVTFPATFEKEALRGQPGRASLRLQQVQRIVPAPIDDALAKGLDFADLAALRADLLARIGQEKQRVGKMRQEEQCLQWLVQKHPFDLPKSLVEEQQQASLHALGERMRQNSSPDEEIEKKLEEAKAEAYQDAERRVRLFFLIDAVAKKHKIFVTESDMDGELRNIAAANDVTPAAVREHLERDNRLGELRLALLERRVRDFLREQARIVDKKGA